MSFTIEKQFDHKGLKCVVITGPIGHRCGYVGIPKSHPLYGIGYHQSTAVLSDAAKQVRNGKIGKRGLIAVLCAAGDENRMTRPKFVFNVHGSLTFSGGSEYGMPQVLARLKAKAEAGDAIMPDYNQRVYEAELKNAGKPIDYPVPAKDIWWFGFDCGHRGDSPVTCDTAYVESECRSLADLLAELMPEQKSEYLK